MRNKHRSGSETYIFFFTSSCFTRQRPDEGKLILQLQPNQKKDEGESERRAGGGFPRQIDVSDVEENAPFNTLICLFWIVGLCRGWHRRGVGVFSFVCNKRT